MRSILKRCFLRRLGWIALVVCVSACEQIDPFAAPPGSTPIVDVGFGVGVDAGFTLPDAGWPPKDPGPQPCDPPLAISPTEIHAVAVSLRSFSATGGTGAYEYDLAAAPSGALVNELSGAYLSGETTGVTDIVRVRDTACVGTSSTTVVVVEPLIVLPAGAEVPPLIEFEVQVARGSGSYAFAMQRSPSGASVSATGLYAAGAGVGEDIVRVTDSLSGETVDVKVNVVAGSEVGSIPAEVHVPVGSPYALRIRGGSGAYAIETTNPTIDLVDGIVMSLVPGSTSFLIEDTLTGQFGEAFVTFVVPQTLTSTRGGDVSLAAIVRGPGDLDGDTYPEAIVGVAEADLTGLDAGAVYVYRGTATGLEAEPAMILGGSGRGDGFGSAIEVADVDGDGLKDLIVGAPAADVNAVDSGGVYVYRGVRGGLFETTRSRTLGGRSGGAGFGSSVAACDFNGDGRIDLAIAAPNGEDLGVRNVRQDQGAVYLFLNYEGTGFLSNADQNFYGALPRGDGTFIGTAGLRLGQAIAAGDVDGDGACDLAASSVAYDGNDGFVYVYRGVAGGLGGLTPEPLAAWADLDDGEGRAGATLALGDITGDGRAEIAIGQPAADGGGGAVHVFLGRSFSGDAITAFNPLTFADWTYTATAGAGAGSSIAIGDVTGEGNADLIIGAPVGETLGGVVDAGKLVIFAGLSGPLPALTPDREIGGTRRGERFGTAAAVIGDPNRDRVRDLAVFAATASDFGPAVGAPYFVSGNPAHTAARLDMPGAPSGAQVGTGLDIVGDVNGDGEADLVTGAPQAHLRTRGLRTGAAYLYLGSPNGFATQPAVEFIDHAELSSGDAFGATVTRLSDFDGDGVDDFAVVAPFDDQPAEYAAHHRPIGNCRARAVSNSGAVFIFRGERNGLPSTTPAFIYWGDQADARIATAAGGFDFNGDGLGDIAVGIPDHNRGNRSNAGRVVILFGRAPDPTGTAIICQPNFSFMGLTEDDRFGQSVAALGDIDADGCDEVAAGAPNENLGAIAQGSVRVFFGFGGPRCSSQASLVAFVSGQADARAGESLAGGDDVDGDGLPDMVVGAPRAAVAGDSVGAIWVVPGDYILSASAITVRDDIPPSATQPFANPATQGVFRANGSTSGEGFGTSVALVAGASGAGAAGIAVGSPQADFPGVPLAGGVVIFRYNRTDTVLEPLGIASRPIAAFAGETDRAGGRMGTRVVSGLLGGQVVLGIGGPRSSGGAIDQGAVYIMTPDPR